MSNDEIFQNSNSEKKQKDDGQKAITGMPVSYILLPLIPSNFLSSNLIPPSYLNQNQGNFAQQISNQPLQQNNAPQQIPQVINSEAVLIPNTDKDSLLKTLLVPLIILSSLVLAGYLGFNYVNGKMTGNMKASIMQSTPDKINVKDQGKSTPALTTPQNQKGPAVKNQDTPSASDTIPPKSDTSISPIPTDVDQTVNQNPLENLPIKR